MLEHYPFENPRPGSEEAMREIMSAFQSGKRFVMVQAPTGAGKSPISVAFSRKFNTTIWTPTKFLQEQYANTPEFSFEYTIRGKSNYNCGLQGQGDVSVDSAICCSDKVTDENRDLVPWPLKKDVKGISRHLKEKCADSGVCPYYSKLAKIPTTPGAILNYDLGLRIKRNPLRKNAGIYMGDSVVLDEAHQIISKIQSIYGYTLTNSAAIKLFGNEGKRGKNEELDLWINRLMTIVRERIDGESDGKKIAKYQKFEKKVDTLLKLDIENEKKFHIDDRGSEVDIKPLDLRYLKNQVFSPFERVLMMSATFPANFRQVLGITEEESHIVKIKSTFKPSKRRAVFPKNIANMNSRVVLQPNTDQIQMLDYILAAHKNEKGIIHCGNYKFFDQLKGLYKGNKRFIWVSQDMDKEEMFYKHVESSNPTVLVSPAMLEGVDLKDDLARFGVLLKVPYPYLDDYTKKMNGLFPGWYENLTITNIVQAYGRQVRNQNDHAVFYIIDGAFKILLNKNKRLFPSYFSEALKIGEASKLVSVLKRKAIEADDE